MTGEKFRARANEYIKAAHAVTDPVRELALMDVAQRWLRLAAQIDRAAIHASAEFPGARNAGPRRAGAA